MACTTPWLRRNEGLPLNGLQRSDVSRLVLTLGRLQGVAPVRLAVDSN